MSEMQKVNPFMQWGAIARASISGLVASTTPAANSDTSKEESGHSATITASTALETGRQVVTSVQSLQGYNHVQPMLPLDNHQQQQTQPQHEQQQQQQQHEQQQQQSAHDPQQTNAHEQSEMIENTHVTPVPSPHHAAAHHAQPANDTAFPGGPLRHNYSIPQQQHHQSHLLTALSHPGAKQAKQLHKTAQGYLDNGDVERNARGDKVERVYECPDCPKSFTREEHLKRHCIKHTDDPVHRCQVPGCTKSYTRKERLTKHVKHAHLGEQPERPFFCRQCGKNFQRKEHLQRHEKNIHGPGGSHPAGSGVASVVHYTSQPGGSIAHHVQQQQQQTPQQQQMGHGNAIGSNTTNLAVLHCTWEGCTKTYTRREHLNRHIKFHQGIQPERSHYCMDCGKNFTRKEHLQRHRRSHTGETPYHCRECTKQFARKEHLKRHERVHSGEHPYPCNECGRSFGRRERLIKHLKSHGVGGNVPPIHKMEFKKEPDNDMQMGSHGVFGDQTTQTTTLLNMIAKRGPLSPEQLGLVTTQAANSEHIFTNPEVAKAFANPEVRRAFSNPEVVKAFAITSPPKKSTTATNVSEPAAPAATTATTMANVVHTTQAMTSRGVDITCTPAVHPELTKMPSGFTIFPIQDKNPQMGVDQSQMVATIPGGYYQTNQGLVSHPHLKPGELATIPMGWSWPQTVNIRSSPAKLEPTDGKHWEPSTAAYFKTPFS